MNKVTENIFRTFIEDKEVLACFRIVSAEFNSIIPEYTSSDIQFLTCTTNDLIHRLLPVNVLVSINECAELTSIILNGTTSNITQEDVEDAILNNSGLINKSILDDVDLIGSITLIFSNCI